MDSVEIKLEIIKWELNFICSQINQYIFHIEKTKKLKDKELHTYHLYEWQGELDIVTALLRTGAECKVRCNHGFCGRHMRLFLTLI